MSADRDQAILPMDLRERVMAASLLARGTGQPVPAARSFVLAAGAGAELLALVRLGLGQYPDPPENDH